MNCDFFGIMVDWVKAADKVIRHHAESLDKITEDMQRRGYSVANLSKPNKRYGWTARTGIVDMVAARLLPRGRRRLKDLIELLLLDAKSGSARSPNTQSRRRLQQAMRNH